MQCPSCHAENSSASRFCQSCGAELNPAAAGGGYTTVPPAAEPTYSTVDPGPGPSYTAPVGGPAAAPYGQPPVMAGGLSDTAAGAIAYITVIPAIVFLLVEPYRNRPFVRFHSVQCIGLTIAWVAISMVLIFMPFHTFLLWALVRLVLFIIWVIAIVSAAQGKWFKLPVIGDIAEKQARRP